MMFESSKKHLEDIRKLELQLKQARQALQEAVKIEKDQGRSSESGLRFLDVDPLEAALQIVKEHGGRMSRAALIARLLEEQVFLGSIRPHSRATSIITIGIRFQRLIEDGDDLVLGKPRMTRTEQRRAQRERKKQQELKQNGGK